MSRPQKITFADMRDMGVRGVLIILPDYSAELVTMGGDRRPNDIRLFNLEPRFVSNVKNVELSSQFLCAYVNIVEIAAS
jgi:hypothetical protein